MKRLFFLLMFCISISILRCVSVPHMVLPQKDISSSELNDAILDRKILVAARSSAFKEAIISQIQKAYQDKPAYIKFIGLSDLKKEDASAYDTVVLMNKCMSWDLDRNVKEFLKRHKDHRHVIILTTSGAGDWRPKMNDREFDVITSASTIARVDEVARELIAKMEQAK